MSLYSAGNRPVIGHPRHFPRSNTSVSDFEVVIGERYFPLHDVVEARVINVAPEPVAPPVDRKSWRFRITSLILLVSAGLFITSLIVGWDSDVGRYLREISLLMGSGVTIEKVFREKVVTPEYRLVLRTRKEESVEVISAQDRGYLDRIAKEINRRVTGTSLPDGGSE